MSAPSPRPSTAPSTGRSSRPSRAHEVVSPAAVPATLAVTEHGDPGSGTHVLLAHGFPDDQSLWDGLVAALPPSWHVVAFDARGAGLSSRPRARTAYRSEHAATDLLAVLDATVPPGEPVHLVAHDWGSIVAWDVVARTGTDPALRARLASYTSISGPSLDHVGGLASTRGGRLRLLPQVLRSWYVWLFLLPGLPELWFGRLQRLTHRVVRRLDPSIDTLAWGEVVAHDAVRTVNLYRANVVRRIRRPAAWRTDVPVLLVVPDGDGFVGPRFHERLEERCSDLRRTDVRGGHWFPRQDPTRLAELLREHVDSQRRAA